MSRSLKIRPRQERDLEACSRLLLAVHEQDGYPVEGVADPKLWLELAEEARAWVAVNEDTVIGHVSLSPVSQDDAVSLWRAQSNDMERVVASLGRLFVSPAARGLGAARALMEEATAFGREQGWQLVLDVMEKDQAAIRLYERLGWVCLGEITHRFGEGERIPARAYALPC